MALARDAQKSCVCPVPGAVQCQIGWDSEQPEPVGHVPAHGGRN